MIRSLTQWIASRGRRGHRASDRGPARAVVPCPATGRSTRRRVPAPGRRPCDYRPGVDPLDGRVLLSAGPLSPAQIRQAYSESFSYVVNGKSYAATGAGQTIAIIEAGLDPYIAADLSTFDQTFGIAAPPSFKDVYFSGAQDNESSGWIGETSLDVEWAHAIAPGASILLVQAASQSPQDLAAAINWARDQPGVSVVSMSFGFPESSAYKAYDSDLTTPAGHTGVTFVASSGDSGYFNSHAGTQVGVQWPADVPTVLSVGGTTLTTASSGAYEGETAWNLTDEGSRQGWWGGGGGYSQVFAEPSYQEGVQRSGVRTVPDVSYNADTAVRVYDSDPNAPSAGFDVGWNGVIGTSAGAPQWAGLIADVNQGRALVGLNPLDGASQTLPGVYEFSSAFHDVTTGSNGYSAGKGYDLATGLGTPIGYELAGDLAFHVTSNYLATPAADASASSIAAAGGGSSIGMASLGAVADARGDDGPVVHRAAEAGGVETPVMETILIGPAPTIAASPFPTAGHRHDRLDLALGSLMDGDAMFLAS